MASISTWHDRYAKEDADIGIDRCAFAWGGQDAGARVLIHAAAMGDQEAVADALAAEVSPDAEGFLGVGTALLVASARGHQAVVEALLAAGATVAVGRDGDWVVAEDEDGIVQSIPIFLPEAAQGLAAAGAHHAVVAILDAGAAARSK